MLPRAPLPFVGREVSLSTILERLQSSPLVILKGLTGSGKTSLLLHLLHGQSKRRSVHYVRLESGLGLEPLFGQDLTSVSSDVGVQALEWVKSVNAFSAEQEPPLWVIDDFHLLSSEMAAPFLRVLNTYLRGWVILGTREELPLSSLERLEYSEEKLGPLDRSASHNLLSQLLSHQGIVASHAELEQQVGRMQGHPLLLRLRAACWNEASELNDASLVHQLSEGLGETGRELLHCLSLCRTPIDEKTIAAWPHGELLPTLSRKFLVEKLGAGWFVPRLVAEQFPNEPRLHQRLSQDFQRLGNPLEALYHALKAGDGLAAREYLEQACRQLCARGEYQELFSAIAQLESMGQAVTAPLRLAVSFALSNRCQWEESLAMLRPLAQDPGYSLDFLSARGGLGLNRGEWANALSDYAQVMQSASPGSEQYMKAAHYSVLLHAYRHETEQARKILESLPALDSDSKSIPLHRYRMESIVCHFEGRSERALETAKKAVEMAEQQGSVRQAGLSRQAEADALCDLGLAQAAVEVLCKTLAWSRQAGEAQVTGYCLLTLGRAYLMLGREVDAATTWQECEMVFLTMGHRNGAAAARTQLMKLQVEHGTLDLAAWQRCLRAAQECGNPPTELELWRIKEMFGGATGSVQAQNEAVARLTGQSVVSSPSPVSVKALQPESPPMHQPDAPVLKVRLLGTLWLKGPLKEVGERDWPTRKSAGLFALLCYAGPQGYSDERLMATFWPDSALEQARSSLRSALHQVRQVLKEVAGEEVAQKLVRSRKTGSVYFENEVELDVAKLDRYLKVGSEHYLRQEYARAAEQLSLGVELYQADFLESFREDWTDLPRDQSRERAIDASHLLALSFNAQQLGEKAEEAARNGLAKDALREELHMDLMEAYLTQGRKAEALRHYKRTIAQFEKELSLYPRSFDSIFPRLVV